MVPAAVNLSAITGMASQLVPEPDAATTTVTTTEGAAPTEGFDALMNSLLGVLTPQTTIPAAGLKTAQKSAPMAVSPEPVPAPDATTVDTDLLALISGGVAPSADSLPADGKTLPPVTGAATDRASKAATTDDTKLDGNDSCPLLSMLMPAETTPAPTAGVTPDSSSALMDGTATASTGATDTPAAPPAENLLALDSTVPPPMAPPPSALAPTSLSDASDPTLTGAAPPASTPSPIAATVPASSSATPTTTPDPVMDAAVGNKITDSLQHTEQMQSARTDTPLVQTTDGGMAGRDASSQNNNSQSSQSLLQEILAKVGGTDGSTRGSGDNFRTLLQGADSGATGNTGALVYSQPGAGAGQAKDAAVPSLPVHTPLRHPEWGDEVSQRVRWVIGNQVQSAELKINPPQLGPIEVRVSVDSDQQMTVTLSSQHALVRETLQESVPRLRDLMSDNGFSGVNVDVSHHSSSDGRRPAAQMSSDTVARTESDAMEADQGTTTVLRHNVRGLVDYYA